MLALLAVCWLGVALANEEAEARCTERDVQKMVLSAVAGALLTMALTGRGRKRSVQTWTRTRDSESQTYEEPAAPGPLAMPPVIQYFITRRRFPMTLMWPDREVGHDIVLSTATTVDRSAWVKALNRTLRILKEQAPALLSHTPR